MLTRQETETLIAELNLASKVYYHPSTEVPEDYVLMEDDEFDSKVELLQTLVDDHADLFEIGSDGFNLLDNDVALGATIDVNASTVHRKVPMLSLGKAKTEDELNKWIAKVRASGATDFVLQAKLDGFALSAVYIDGVLTQLSTRGQGLTGEDTSYLFKSDEIEIVGLPSKINAMGTIEVRGEMFLTEDQFAVLDANRLAAHPKETPFKNPRNGLIGSIKKANKGLDYQAPMTFATYSALKNDSYVNLEEISSLGFKTVNEITQEQDANLKLTGFKDDSEVYKAVHAFGEARKSFTIPTDGVVIKPTNEKELHEEMGVSSHHPKSQIAFKYPGEEAITDLLGIDLTVGRTGKITPVGRIKTVYLDGSDLSNLSLHNFNLIYTKNIRVGQTVKVYKANDIIPQIKSVLATPDGATLIAVPTECPTCAGPVVAAVEDDGNWPPRTLRCDTLTCPDREFGAVKLAVSKELFNIDRMSEATLTSLRDEGLVTDIADLFTLSVDDLAKAQVGVTKVGNPKLLGLTTAKHIMNYIDAARNIALYKVLASLNIIGLGKSLSKLLIKEFKDLDGILNASIDDIARLDGFGLQRAVEIHEGLKIRRPLIDKLVAAGLNFETPKVNTDTSLAGLSFAISGAVPEPFSNRGAWVEHLEKNGAAFHSGPKANTDYFVGSDEDTSSKAKAAVKHRDSGKSAIQIISPERFTELFV